ncbi:aldehyde dehydrogenase family protein, partial [Micrococcus sp. SIMBA_144]
RGERAYTQARFGMAAVVYKVSSAGEAVALANDSQYGLGGAVFSTDRDEAKRVADQLEVGMANVNLAAAAGANLPFGGVKRSGFGRELGHMAVDEFANK